MMKILMLFVLSSWTLALQAATLASPTGYAGSWPEPWFGKNRGADATVADPNPVEGDNDHEFDYGKDEWGYWANIEIEDPHDGSFIAIEMRYIPVDAAEYGNGSFSGAFLMGAPRHEQGSRPEERPQIVVPTTDINGGRGLWVSAEECSQFTWQTITGTALSAQDTDDDGEPDLAPAANNQRYFDSEEIKERAVDSRTITDVTQFCSLLGAVIGRSVSLPTEKEWEYLCRSGTGTAFYTGRILNDVTGSVNFNLDTTTSDFMFDFAEADIESDIPSIPFGDEDKGGITPKWVYRVNSVNAEGIPSWDTYLNPPKREIHGVVNVTGTSTVQMGVTAHFDNQYQHRYVADYYGLYTPVLMLYKLDGAEFKPVPYGDPKDAGMYYRLLDDENTFFEVSAIEAQLKQQNHPGSIHDLCPDDKRLTPFWFQRSERAGDWYSSDFTNPAITPQQLQYREMVPAYVRYKPTSSSVATRNVNLSEWEEAYDGTHVLVSEPGLTTGTYIQCMYPLRSMYSQYRFNSSGSLAAKTLPLEVSAAAVISAALDTVPSNESGKNGPGKDMTVNDYVSHYNKVVVEYYDANVLEKDFWEPLTDSEKQNINKSDIVSFGIAKRGLKSQIQVTGVENVTTTTADVGRSPWGLANMHGNLEEWTSTTWDGKSNHEHHATGGFQITRGGSLQTGADRCRSAARTARKADQRYDDVGFRFVIRN